MNAACSASIRTGRIPADWDASSRKGTPASAHSAAISSTGCTQPNTLDTWLQITASTPCASASFSSSTILSGWKGGVFRTVSVTLGMAWSGRVTALCS